ncbi:hypothetical protein JYG33_14895 [Alcaligenes sp. SORT26]|nr:hypothetical protein JYG33_14895 [Alcaligenes sp. SORT26]
MQGRLSRQETRYPGLPLSRQECSSYARPNVPELLKRGCNWRFWGSNAEEPGCARYCRYPC